MPLTMHHWARAAAEGAACAQVQNDRSFWELHDSLFENQAVLTEDNIRPKLLEFSRKIPSLDSQGFRNCLDSEMSLGLVLRDMNVAETDGVKVTPRYSSTEPGRKG